MQRLLVLALLIGGCADVPEPGQHFVAKPYTIEALERRIDELFG